MNLLPPLLGGLVAALLVYLLSTTVRGESSQRQGRYTVEYGPAYKLMSIAFFPFSAFVLYAALRASDDQKALALTLSALFWVGTLYLAYEILFFCIRYDDEYIYH